MGGVRRSAETTAGLERVRALEPRRRRIGSNQESGVTSNNEQQPSQAQGVAESMMRARRAELQADYERCLEVLRAPADPDFDNGEASDREGRADAAIMASHLRQEIRAVDEALARMAEGSYGRCTECGRRIARGRLAAVPAARRCIRCQARFERKAG